MDDAPLGDMSPDLCAGKIFEISGEKFAPETAVDLWPRILKHKWLLSEKLGRDVGLRTACIDYIDNMEQARKEFMAYQRRDILAEMGAQTISRDVWDTISDSQPPKKLVQQKIILPLTEKYLSEKHGVVPPERAAVILSLQGVRMGRPSRVHVAIGLDGGEIARVQVGGEAVLVGEGELFL